MSTSNSYTDDTGYLALEPAFTQERYEYTAEMYNGKNKFLNIFAEPQEEDAFVTVEGIRGTKKINNYGHTAGSGSASRITVYGDERQSLNVWTEAADAHGSIKVYAMSGILGSSVLKDETILQTGTDEGHPFWKIVFASGEKEAKIRIQVIAEDGTRKNVYLTLRLTDKTAPVLKKVSAIRISTDKASVVYKTSEKGYRYYKVVDADKKIPVVNTSGKGTEVQAGTDIIILTGLTSVEKDLVVVVKDCSGNVSQQLVIRIPDIKNAGSGTGNNGNNSSVIQRSGSGGHKSEVGKPVSGSEGNGSKANLKRSMVQAPAVRMARKTEIPPTRKRPTAKGKRSTQGSPKIRKKQMRKIMEHLENLPGKRQKQQMVPLHQIPVQMGIPWKMPESRKDRL